MIMTVLIGIIKIIDNIIGVIKQIAVYKHKLLLTFTLTVLSQFIYYYIIKYVITGDSNLVIIVVCVTSGIGAILGMLITDRFGADQLWTNILTCDETDNVEELATYLVSNKIKFVIMDSYDRCNKRTKTIMAFAKTRDDSRIIDDFLERSNVKFLRQVLR